MQLGMLFMNKMQMKSAVRAYSLAIKKEFLCDQSKSKSWKVICKRHELGCDFIIRFREIFKRYVENRKNDCTAYLSYRYL